MSDDPAAPSANRPGEVTESDRPVTFRELFALREYRALYFSMVVNWVGDYLSRAAVTVLVYQQSESVLLSAAAFAVAFLPWVVGGTVLAALADRYPYHRVLITTDLCRMVLIALLLIPELPIPVMLVLLFLSSCGAPPAQAARSALLPLLVGRDKLPIAVATNASTMQAAQVVGYLAGAALATAISPQVALGIDAVTFALAAFLVARWVRPRPPARKPGERTHLLQESGEGFRLVFGQAALRSIAIMVFVLAGFVVVPEGLAAAWAAQDDTGSRGLSQGLIMAAGPIGYVIGGILIGRLARPAQRDWLVRPLAVLSTLTLVPALLSPPPPVVAALVAVAGLAQGGVMPTLNSRFVLILPNGYRARAFGVMQTGLQVSQFSAIMITGVLADHFRLPLVVGLWSIGGTLVMAVLALRWPRPDTFTEVNPATGGWAAPSVRPGRHRAGAVRPAVVTTSITPDRR